MTINKGNNMTDIEKVFEKHLSHIKFDKNFYKLLQTFRIYWVNKNPNHVEFLSGILLGVHPIRFTIDDDAHFWIDILEIDVDVIRKDLHNLPDIYPERNVTSNVFYLTITYIMRKFTLSNMSKSDTLSAIEETYLIFAYKALSSLDSHYFKFSLDPETALVVSEKLSKKYQIKQFGSWQATLEYRSKDFKEGGLHAKRLIDYTTVNATLILSDAQGRLRDIYKQIWGVLAKVLEEGASHSSTSLVGTDATGEDNLRDVIDRPDQYVFYIKSIVHDQTEFIKTDLIKIISSMFSNVDISDVLVSLKYISERSGRDKGIDEIIESVMTINIDYLSTSGFRSEYDQSIIAVIKAIKGLWSRNRVKNKSLEVTKKNLTRIIKKGTGIKTTWKISTIVLSVVIYIFIRAVLKDKLPK